LGEYVPGTAFGGSVSLFETLRDWIGSSESLITKSGRPGALHIEEHCTSLQGLVTMVGCSVNRIVEISIITMMYERNLPQFLLIISIPENIFLRRCTNPDMTGWYPEVTHSLCHLYFIFFTNEQPTFENVGIILGNDRRSIHPPFENGGTRREFYSRGCR